MARKAIGVDIGSRYVKVAEVVREGAHTRVVACVAQEIADSSDAARADAIVRAMRAAGIRGRRVVCDVARSDAVVKRIHLPATARETVRKILEFEVQQHVPFPAEETAWDFRVDDEGAVLLAAVRQRSLDAVRGLVAQAGLRESAITISSAAAAGAYLQDVAETAGEHEPGAAVLIELGAGLVVVNVFRGRTWLLSRPLPLRGDDLTAAFAADLGCDVGRARSIQQVEGFAALPEAAPRVAEWTSALRAEVERSLLAAAEQATALAVERLMGTGGGWLTPGLAQAVSHALGGNLEIVPSGPQPVTPAFGVAIGLALQGLGLGEGLDLTASATAGTRRQARRSLGSAVAIAGLVVMLVFGTWRYWAVQQRSLALHPTQAAAARRERDMRDLRTRRQALEAQASEVQRLLRPRHQVLNALQDLSAVAPRGMWLTSVSYTPGRPVAVQGKAASASQVSDLLDAMKGRAALIHVKQGDKDVDFAISLESKGS